MSQELINRSPDLKQLQDEGFELEVSGSHAIVHHVPYLNDMREIREDGILVSPIALQGQRASYKHGGTHVIYFKGEMPCELDSNPITSIQHDTNSITLAGIECDYSFSNKPQSGYRDYYEKFTRYIDIISAPAKSKDDNVTAKTYRRIISSGDSVFIYEDTNASRAGISFMNDLFKEQKIGIIGLGGTGSYILDLIAKTPVAEIHLFDGDDFCQHNAFRAPGAAKMSIFPKVKNKARYFKKVYDEMHKNIIAHALFLKKQNQYLLRGLDFVFVCVDSGTARQVVISALLKYGIRFIDTGIGIDIYKNELYGAVRNTAIINGKSSSPFSTIFFDDNADDVYASNVQTADLNCFCATLAVIKWKKIYGFYQDLNPKDYTIYSLNDGELHYED